MTSPEPGRLWRFVTKDFRTLYVFGFDVTTWYAARQFAITYLRVPYDCFTMDSKEVDEIPRHSEYVIVSNGEIASQRLTGASRRTVEELSQNPFIP